MKSKYWIPIAWVVGCGGPAEPVEGLVVVQETNLTACQLAHTYDRMVTRTCNSTVAPVQVCSDKELCEAQLVELTASIANCTNDSDSFPAETTASCD